MINWNEYFNYDDGLLLSKSGHIYCNLDRDGYIRVRFKGKEYRAHRIIWEMFNKQIPSGYIVDHIDRDPFNNRIENLRLATNSNNRHNSTTSLTNLPKGVQKVGKKYRARIYRGKWYSLGSFESLEEAAEAYTSKSRELDGEFTPY